MFLFPYHKHSAVTLAIARSSHNGAKHCILTADPFGYYKTVVIALVADACLAKMLILGNNLTIDFDAHLIYFQFLTAVFPTEGKSPKPL